MEYILEKIEQLASFLGTDSLTLVTILLILMIVGMITNFVHQFRKSERVRKNYTPKIGDIARGHASSTNLVSGEVVEITADDVYLKVKINKKWLYPNKN